jgi:hypothetical protein
MERAMRTHVTLTEIIDDIVRRHKTRQTQIEHEALDDEEYLDLEDILLAQNRTKRWLEEQ